MTIALNNTMARLRGVAVFSQRHPWFLTAFFTGDTVDASTAALTNGDRTGFIGVPVFKYCSERQRGYGSAHRKASATIDGDGEIQAWSGHTSRWPSLNAHKHGRPPAVAWKSRWSRSRRKRGKSAEKLTTTMTPGFDRSRPSHAWIVVYLAEYPLILLEPYVR